MKYVSTAILIAIASGSAMSPLVAKAEDIVTFKLKAVELDSSDGREKLLGRMKSKAKMACYGQSFSPYGEIQTSKQCRESLTSQWIAAIGSPALASLHRSGDASVAAASR